MRYIIAMRIREENENAALPVSSAEMLALGIERPDFVYVIGDAYIDHPAFGPAIISRVLVQNGYSVAIIPQPDWHSDRDFLRFPAPRLGFLVSAGNMDSMVNHYTSAKKRRSEDAYTPGGKSGARPDRATIVYCNRIRSAFKGSRLPIIIGGIEASLRRFAHYDYWEDKVRRSILSDAGADILIYGMGEKQIVELADALDSGLKAEEITYIAGTCVITPDLSRIYDYQKIEGFEEISKDKKAYCRAFMAQYREQDPIRGKRLVQEQDAGRYLVQNPPAMPLSREELDAVYELPYTRRPHPSYKEHIPAIGEVEFSLVSCRGCFGACSFCALTFHQGRIVQSRSHASLLREAEILAALPNFKGNIHDVGGSTADFRKPACKKQLKNGACENRQCLGFSPCPNVEVDHSDYVALLKKLRALPNVKNVFVRSGIRYDYVMYDKDDSFLKELAKYHVSGRLKVAPEHIDERVLQYMGKPARGLYDRFVQKYMAINQKLGKEQYVVPYFMSSHPGSDLSAAVELAEYLKRTGQRPEQVQDFYPTPGTLSTCMYHTGLDPRTMETVYVPRSPREKEMQRALMQFFMPQYRARAREALIKAGREDLIGFGKDALLPPAFEKSAEKGGTDERRNTGRKSGAKKEKPPKKYAGRAKKR